MITNCQLSSDLNKIIESLELVWKNTQEVSSYYLKSFKRYGEVLLAHIMEEGYDWMHSIANLWKIDKTETTDLCK